MANRLSRTELYRLRNQIPVRSLIQHILKLSCNTETKHLRFTCPLCRKTEMAINPQANLTRCFSCQRNFNPIEIVMAYQNISFLASVTLLKRLEPQLMQAGQQRTPLKYKPISTNTKTTQSIGEILKQIARAI